MNVLIVSIFVFITIIVFITIMLNILKSIREQKTGPVGPVGPEGPEGPEGPAGTDIRSDGMPCLYRYISPDRVTLPIEECSKLGFTDLKDCNMHIALIRRGQLRNRMCYDRGNHWIPLYP